MERDNIFQFLLFYYFQFIYVVQYFISVIVLVFTIVEVTIVTLYGCHFLAIFWNLL